MITTELVGKNNFGNQNTRLACSKSVVEPPTFYPSSKRVFER